MVQVATKERMLTKEEEGEPLEIHSIPRIQQKTEKGQKLAESFFDKLIGQAKFI